MSETWQYFQYTWDDLLQPSWAESSGVPGDPLVLTNVYGVRFQVDQNIDFDFTIDDVMFLCP